MYCHKLNLTLIQSILTVVLKPNKNDASNWAIEQGIGLIHDWTSNGPMGQGGIFLLMPRNAIQKMSFLRNITNAIAQITTKPVAELKGPCCFNHETVGSSLSLSLKQRRENYDFIFPWFMKGSLIRHHRLDSDFSKVVSAKFSRNSVSEGTKMLGHC